MRDPQGRSFMRDPSTGLKSQKSWYMIAIGRVVKGTLMRPGVPQANQRKQRNVRCNDL
jgi:hypothetical protein